MEVQLATVFLPLLLLTWLLAGGLAHQISAQTNVSVELDLVLQCLLQTGSSGTTSEMKCFNTIRNNGEKQDKADVEIKNCSAELILTSVNKARAATYTGKTKKTGQENSRQTRSGTVSQAEESDITMEYKLSLTGHVKWYKPAGLELWKQLSAMAPGEDSANLRSPGASAASTGICGCQVSITRVNWTDTGNETQRAGPSCDRGALQTSVTEEKTWIGFSCLLCITFGLAVGTLLHMPIICLLLWQRRRDRKGKLVSGAVVESNQLGTAAPVTGTEDLTYVNLKFEKKGTKAASSSDVVYTEIKPLQQKQSGGDAMAGVDGSPGKEGEQGGGRDEQLDACPKN